MYDFQNTVLLSARPTKGTLILRNVALLLVALTLLGCIWINMFSFAPLFIAAMAFWWWGTFRTGLEYEYTYFDGDLDFDKIRAKSKRKHILSIHMDNVTSIVPENDPSLYNIHQNSGAKIVDVSSRKPDRKVYEIVHQDAGVTTCIRFEPDEKFLDSISIKYGRKITR